MWNDVVGEFARVPGYLRTLAPCPPRTADLTNVAHFLYQTSPSNASSIDTPISKHSRRIDMTNTRLVGLIANDDLVVANDVLGHSSASPMQFDDFEPSFLIVEFLATTELDATHLPKLRRPRAGGCG